LKAIRYERYGPPEVLHLAEVPIPPALDAEVLVKVYAASVNALDWHKMRGAPFMSRLAGLGLRRPKNPKMGVDIAGRVESLGKNAKEFRPGDEVFGVADGAFGECVSAAERELTRKPANVSFEAAASVPIAGFTALQGLRDRGGIRAGQKVLVNGASGGVGTFAVQIAKSYGTDVTAVCSTRNLEPLRSIGADRVVDYTKEDFARNGQRYDLIVDMVGDRSVAEYRRSLTPDGIAVVLGFSSVSRLFQVLIWGSLVSRTGRKKIRFMIAKPAKKDLEFLGELLKAGKIVPVIDRRYPLSGVPDAIAYLEGKHARGKVVITVQPDPAAPG
jgi:NADPH:quinone reductase-like Zn-dependent oxidoreductase